MKIARSIFDTNSGRRASARIRFCAAHVRAEAHTPRLQCAGREYRNGCNRRAFTLVEVLATLVLLGIILPAVMKGTTMALSAASAARHTTEASDLAASKLHDLVAENLWDQSTGGDFSPDFPQYHWQVSSSSMGNYGVYNVQITVNWIETGRDRKLTLTTLAYDTSTDTGSDTGNGTGTNSTSTSGGLP